jgi:hypothetical protein
MDGQPRARETRFKGIKEYPQANGHARRRAEQRHELASFQFIELHSVPVNQGRI